MGFEDIKNIIGIFIIITIVILTFKRRLKFLKTHIYHCRSCKKDFNTDILRNRFIGEFKTKCPSCHKFSTFDTIEINQGNLNKKP